MAMVILPAGAGAGQFAGKPDLVRIPVSGQVDVRELVVMDLDITTVRPGRHAEAWITAGERECLLAAGFQVISLPDPSREFLDTLGQQGYIPQPGREWTSYPTWGQMTDWLEEMETDHPGICRLISIGQSVQGRDLWVMKISDNAAVEEAEPEVKLISSMHGNENLGVPLCLNLIEYLLEGYGSDPEVTGLVDNREIFIMPLMNPDGYTHGSRYNANGVDLNRDFPDFVTDPVNTIDGRAVETALVMLWQPNQTFVLSANFHTGARVVNYPWDSTYDYNPDDTFFYNLSLGYAFRNEPMWNSSSFENGVVRGSLWYVIHGGMQDWNYYWYADYDVTIELSNPSSPPPSQIAGYWDDNRESMLYLIDLSGKGLTGTVTDAVSGDPLAAEINVSGIDMPTTVRCDPDHGNYVRPLYTGQYTVTYSADGYQPQTLDNVPVTWEDTTVRDITLVPLAVPGFSIVLVALDDTGGGNGNGVIEPGETVDLTITLENSGTGTATGIEADLGVSDQYVTIDQAQSTWPDLAEGATGDNSSADGGVEDSEIFPLVIGGTMVVTGPGPGSSNPPLVRVYSAGAPAQPMAEWSAYGTPAWGVNLAAGDLDGNGVAEVLTGAGPGAVFGPHVRAFSSSGAAVSAVNFLAYGTNKFGVNVSAGDFDGDGMDEIVTGAGPGAVFGPHVRGWNSDGGPVSPVAGVSYFAYGTPKWGVNVACGDIDGDGFDEIVTGAGPGAIYGPHVRGWNVDGAAAAAIPAVSFLAYGTNKFGVKVACGDLDGDGMDEIITGAGPGVVFGAHVRGWNVDGGSVSALPGVNFFAYPGALYGVSLGCGDLDADGFDEILTMPGPDPDQPARLRSWNVDGGAAAAGNVDFEAYGDLGLGYGGTVSGGAF